MSRLSCLLARSEMLGLSFNTLTVDHIYSCHDREKLAQQVKTQLPTKPKTFSEPLFAI